MFSQHLQNYIRIDETLTKTTTERIDMSWLPSYFRLAGFFAAFSGRNITTKVTCFLSSRRASSFSVVLRPHDTCLDSAPWAPSVTHSAAERLSEAADTREAPTQATLRETPRGR